jgi:hypothetical protein
MSAGGTISWARFKSVRDLPGRLPNASKVGSGQQKIRSHPPRKKKVHWPVLLFLLALVVPWAIYIGPLRMSLYRIVLLVMVLPCLGMWLAGRAGRVRTADLALLLFSFWCTLSLIVLHGIELPIQTVGIVFIETVGPYMLARCYIRDADDFYNLVQLLFRIVVVLFPFAIVEFITGKDIWRDLFAAIWPVQVDKQMASRGGLTRVQMGFDHPILFGMCIASILAPVHLILGYRRGSAQRSFKTAIVGAVAFMSLSAGPFVSLVVQGLLLSFNFLVRAIKIPWTILIGLLVLISLALQLVAKRSLLDIAASFLVFEPGSYWYRKMIWNYGVASVLKHPLYGIGLNSWERGSDMSTSVDNFWLLLAMRYGLPASFLLLLTLLSIFLALGFKKGLDDKIMAYRTAFLISMTSFFLVGWTVHFWDAGYVLFTFTMGAGIWMLDVRPKERAALQAQVFESRRIGEQVQV